MKALFYRIALTCFAIALCGSANAHDPNAEKGIKRLGEFDIVNSGGFVERDDKRIEMQPDLDVAHGEFSLDLEDKALSIEMKSGAKIKLEKIEDGIAAFSWDPGSIRLLHRQDIMQIAGVSRPQDVETWATQLQWPDVGPATIVLFKYNEDFYGGFLVSRSKETTFVRQMEIHRWIGPRRRADNTRSDF
ncbi:MAG: hypothetical protein HWE23_01910 [Rhodobacteraceae bacterium]|nr:hypothetical protein [Paracoccaceae bacterium]